MAAFGGLYPLVAAQAAAYFLLNFFQVFEYFSKKILIFGIFQNRVPKIFVTYFQLFLKIAKNLVGMFPFALLLEI